MRVHLLLASCLAVGLLASSPATAVADDRAGPTGGGTGVEPSHYSAVELASADAKSVVVDAYAKYRSGGMSASEFAAIEAAWMQGAGLDGPSALDAPQLRFGTVDASPMSCPVEDPCPQEKVLDITHSPQRESYFCGPATGVMIALYLRAGGSAYDGKSLGQYNMANGNHMRTSANGKTAYASGLFTSGLNRWLRGSSTGFYSQTDNPSTAAFTNRMVYAIDARHPFGVGTVELRGETSYNHHNTSNDDIGHWLVGRGYKESGGQAFFADPATSVWRDTNAFFNRSTSPFVGIYVDNGISA